MRRVSNERLCAFACRSSRHAHLPLVCLASVASVHQTGSSVNRLSPCSYGRVYDIWKGVCKWVKRDRPTTRVAYHLVWIPKYRRRVLVGDVQVETKRLIAECCERQGLTLVAVETDEDHIHVFVSAPPRFSPALIANLLKGYTSRFATRKSILISKRCVERTIFGQAVTVSVRRARCLRKPSHALL